MPTITTKTAWGEELTLKVIEYRQEPALVVVEYPLERACGEFDMAEDNVEKRPIVAYCSMCRSLYVLMDLMRTYAGYPSYEPNGLLCITCWANEEDLQRNFAGDDPSWGGGDDDDTEKERNFEHPNSNSPTVDSHGPVIPSSASIENASDSDERDTHGLRDLDEEYIHDVIEDENGADLETPKLDGWSSDLTSRELVKNLNENFSGFTMVTAKSRGDTKPYEFRCSRYGNYRDSHKLDIGFTSRQRNGKPTKCSCPLQIRGLKRFSSEFWNLSIVNGHHNHQPAMNDQVHHMRRKRMLDDNTKTSIREQFQIGTPPKLILDMLRSRYEASHLPCPLYIRDIYNMRRDWSADVFDGRNPIERMHHDLGEDENIIFRIRSNLLG